MRRLLVALSLLAGCGKEPVRPSEKPQERPQEKPQDSPAPATPMTPQETARIAFRDHAAKVLGTTPKNINAGQAIAGTGTVATTKDVGRAWAFLSSRADDPQKKLAGWAMPDGTVFTLDHNLGLLFEEGGMWSTPPAIAPATFGETLAWSMGWEHWLANNPLRPLTPTFTVNPDGTGTFKFVTNWRPPGPGGGAGGGPENLTETTIVVTKGKRDAQVTKKPYTR
jgi:hypothetical protein